MKKLYSLFSGNARRFGSALAMVFLASFVSVQSAFAQTTPTFDPTDTLAMVADAKSFITTVGLAVLALIMLAKGIRWVRKAG